jgi:hypothetical protein
MEEEAKKAIAIRQNMARFRDLETGEGSANGSKGSFFLALSGPFERWRLSAHDDSKMPVRRGLRSNRARRSASRDRKL